MSFTNCTGANLYVTTFCQLTGPVTLGNTLYPYGGSNSSGMTITSPYNNLKFASKSSADPNGAGSYWSIVGNTAEGGSTLFRIFNSPTGGMAYFYGAGDATNLTNGAISVQGGLSVTNTTYNSLINCGTGSFTSLLSINATIPQLTVISAYFNSITGSNLLELIFVLIN